MKFEKICLGVLVAVLSAAPAWAEPNEADRATARALALEGHAALERKDYATAADRFGRADSLIHAPTLVVDLARALQGLGRLAEAHEKYSLVLLEGADSASPKSWLRALEDAKKEFEALTPRLAWVTVILRQPTDATVRIDGVVVPPAAIGMKRAANPGVPEVTIDAFGYEGFKQSIALGPGDEKLLEITLQELPPAAAPVAASSAGKDAYRPRQRNDTREVLTYVAFGVGGVALVAGGVTGFLAMQKHSDLESECANGFCRSASHKKLESYHLYGTVSAAGLAVGVAGIGTGLVLVLTRSKSAEAAGAGFTVQPLLGLGTVGAEGTF
jgi:hypothetical protein